MLSLEWGKGLTLTGAVRWGTGLPLECAGVLPSLLWLRSAFKFLEVCGPRYLVPHLEMGNFARFLENFP